MKPWQKFATHSKGGAKGAAFGFSSGLERAIADQLLRAGTSFDYEAHTIRYTVPEKIARYTPDFVLLNGIVVEVKGLWETADRGKHSLIKAQYPDLDIRFVFSNSNTKIGKKSATTYGLYCQRLGIPYADRMVPSSWLTMNKADAKRRFEALLAACQPSS